MRKTAKSDSGIAPVDLGFSYFMSSFGVNIANFLKSLLVLQQGEEVGHCEEELFSTLEVMPGNCTVIAIPPTRWRHHAILQY